MPSSPGQRWRGARFGQSSTRTNTSIEDGIGEPFTTKKKQGVVHIERHVKY